MRKARKIHSTRCDRGKLIIMLGLYYDELVGKIEERKGKEYLMIDNYILDKVLVRMKNFVISIEKFDDGKTLIDTDYILPDDIIFKNAVILMTSVINDNDKFYPQLFLEQTLYDE